MSLGDRGHDLRHLRLRDGTSVDIGERALNDLDEVHDPPDEESTCSQDEENGSAVLSHVEPVRRN